MKSRLTTVFLVLALAMFATVGAVAASGHISHSKGKAHAKKHHAKKHKKHAKKHSVTQQTAATDDSKSSAQSQYGTRPGKGCGDTNHVHTGPPGNPSNTSCPPQSQQHKTSSTTTTAKAKAHAKRKHARHKKARKRGHH